jgi:hypothetical protein
MIELSVCTFTSSRHTTRYWECGAAYARHSWLTGNSARVGELSQYVRRACCRRHHFPAGAFRPSDVGCALGSVIAAVPVRTTVQGRAASVRPLNSSLESGRWNSAAGKRPVVSACSRPVSVVWFASKRTFSAENSGVIEHLN